ncbi:MAG: hypothetical protein H6757_06105 [Candidatus Omnitrophica bacterium]|nr:hypothetical protein [Candidatus Omnitrophota bacterium]
MAYFKGLSFVLGIIWLGCGVMAFLMPQLWKKLLIGTLWPEKKAVWLIPVSLLMVGLTLTAWIMCFSYLNGYSVMITGFLTLGVIKLGIIVPNYHIIRRAVVAFIGEKVPYNFIMGCSVAMGAGFIYVGTLIK